MKITLIYFNFPFWRAEVSRISLNSCSIDFYDKRITSEEFQNVKEKGTLHDGTIIPFHQLPCLKVDNITIAQTGAISRFCGKLANLYPKENNIVAAKIDQFIDILTDITTIITSTEVEHRDATFLNKVHRKLFILNKSIDEKHDYIVNNYFSIADIAIWSFVCWLTGGNIAAVPIDIAKYYTNIINICRKVDNRDIVKNWVNKNIS